jgi:hypothetical protein
MEDGQKMTLWLQNASSKLRIFAWPKARCLSSYSNDGVRQFTFINTGEEMSDRHGLPEDTTSRILHDVMGFFRSSIKPGLYSQFLDVCQSTKICCIMSVFYTGALSMLIENDGMSN